MSRPVPSRTATPVRPAPNAPYFPPSESSTYRDLLLFEERLKSNAEMLRRRRRRYSVFLWSFVAALVLMGHKLVFQPPNTLFSLRALQASVAVVFITLALFFASGMYEEKIRYAYSYINHSNKALRPLNMHLNMRRPRVSLLSYIPILSSYVRSESPPVPPAVPAPTSSLKPALLGKGIPSVPNTATNPFRRVSATPNVMATIPPSSNPRGELIFSSRVDRSFREGYERYRSAFERRREEKAREEARLNGDNGILGWITRRERGYSPISDGKATPIPTPPLSRRGTPTPPLSSTLSRSLSSQNAGQPQTSTRRTPSPASGLRHTLNANDTTTDPPLNDLDTKAAKLRDRAESYSFVWTGPGTGKGKDIEVLRRAP